MILSLMISYERRNDSCVLIKNNDQIMIQYNQSKKFSVKGRPEFICWSIQKWKVLISDQLYICGFWKQYSVEVRYTPVFSTRLYLAWIPTWLLSIGKLHNLSLPHFPRIVNGEMLVAHLLLWKWNEMLYIKHLVEFLA